MKFTRTDGQRAGCEAELNCYPDGKANLVISLDHEAAGSLLRQVVDGKSGFGSLEIAGRRLTVELVGGRLRTHLPDGTTSAAGIIQASSLR